MIQLLGVTDQLHLNVLDARDRTCMHYAAIKGKSSVINALFMLNRQSGGQLLTRAEIDPTYVEEPWVGTKRALKEFNEDINKLNAEIEAANLEDELPKERRYSDEGFEAGFGEGDGLEEEKEGEDAG